VAEIPYRFPLATGWPEDRDAEPGQLGREGPYRSLDSLQFAVCDVTFDDPPYADRLRADWTDVEDQRKRQLTTYADADRAVEALHALTEFFRACPTEDFDDGFTRVGQVIRTDMGDEAWATVRYFEHGGARVAGLEIFHAIRVGRAVLIDTVANKAGAGADPKAEVQDQIDAMSVAAAVPVSAMCMFTESGCPDSLSPAPRRFRRP
jgi:hypothetical protein